ncbi:MAG: deoxyribonuclease IV [Duncaniella sp.]|nr:deoxyribonuclease IV [Duncaniella sp.]
MKHIGAHVSAENGVSSAPLNAAEIGAKAFALFTRNPSRWKSKPIPEAEAEKFKELCSKLGYAPEFILPHDSYLINLGSPDKEKLDKSREAFADEMARCMQLGLTMLNFHPGSHLNLMEPDECLDRIAESLNMILDTTSGVKAVIENTAGQGSNLGYSFEQIARIIDKVEDKERVGVCIDTCHAFSAGYDLSTTEGYRRTWDDFDNIIGRKYLSGMHLNDSMRPRLSRIDRHAPIGEGTLGMHFFEMLMADDRLDNIPIILETPYPERWPEEIKMLYEMVPQR